VGAPIVAPALALDKLFEVILMTLNDDMATRYGLPDGGLVPDGKPHRAHAPGDKPGQCTGFYVAFLEDEGFFTSWHPHSTVIWHRSSLDGGRSAR
jgi:hypothetical protein